MSEYTPTTDEVRETYERARYYLDDMPEEGDSYRAGGGEFDRWITAHDRELRRKWMQEATEDVIAHDEALEKALREQIAWEIVAYVDDDGTDEWFAAIDLAARIARGEDQTDEH